MKWQPVNKTLWLFILALVIGLTGTFAWHTLHSPRFLMNKHQKAMKIGFVDLMSHQEEMYNVDVQVLDDCILATFTDPKDPGFLIKANMVEVKKYDDRYNYKFSPVITSSTVKTSMAWEYIEMLTHTDLWMQAQDDNQRTLMIGKEGVVFPL
ncbi:hypothetical protein ACI2I2_06380 [Scandinavium sp. NPDC088450]|uniref:hypothetical protein n=1 Tax=Scandinavium sp. NPDC088450 TaxID=3364514 RepID=UPI00384CB9E6